MDKGRMTDEDLVREYIETANPEMFGELVSRYEPKMRRHFSKRLYNHATVDDLVQQLFCNVYTRLGMFDLSQRFSPWLYSVASNLATDTLRQQTRRHRYELSFSYGADCSGDELCSGNPAPVDPLSGPLAQLEIKEDNKLLRRAVSRLPKLHCAAVRLVYFDGLKHTAAATKLGIPPGTLKSRLHSAINKLRQRLASSL